MSWNENRARTRINDLAGRAPKVRVERFETDYLQGYRDRGVVLAQRGQKQTPPLFELGPGRAVIVHTVQIYVRIVNFDEFRLESEGETERAHERMLRFLHVLYSACDRVADQCEVQRVDFHGSRMHAVVLGTDPNGVTLEDVGKAFRFVTLFRELAEEAIRDFAAAGMQAAFRFGVDSGTCVAIDNGTAIEPEPMFLGSPANHAAKLAEGAMPGIYVSDAVRGPLGNPAIGTALESALQIDQASVARALDARSRTEGLTAFGIDRRSRTAAMLMEDWKGEIARSEVPDPTVPRFTFRHQPPPLKNIVVLADLSPSRSLRLPLVSLFADLSSFTAYIDAAVRQGCVADAVRSLYVLRAEFQNVVQEDFGGRKVRFIGDCIHAVLSEGTATTAEPRRSVATAVQTAAALQASFAVCQSILPDTRRLGLAIGLEHGPTPITRLGIRGRRAIRVASSVACCQSDQEQRALTEGVRVGPRALDLLPVALRPLFDADGATPALDYDDVCMSSGKVAAAAATPMALLRAPVTASPQLGRAHFRG